MRSYGSPFNLGHAALEDLFAGIVQIQEKIDGSQFSFGVFDGQLVCRSRNRVIPDLEHAEMFQLAVDHAVKLFNEDRLQEGWTYRCEYLSKPKHNTLAYDRVPRNNLIIFDIDQGDQMYLPVSRLAVHANLLRLEAVPHLAEYNVIFKPPFLEELKEYLQETSILGNVKVEGIVIKNYSRYDASHKVLMGKLVSEDFKERHSRDWKIRNPGKASFIGKVIEEFATEARWLKGIQHLQEAGELKYEPQDIPLVLREIANDVLDEAGEEIKEKMFKYFWKKYLSRGIIKGLPEFYKAWLVERTIK